MAKGLRLLIGLLILGVPALFGWYFRSPFVIPVLAVIYVPLYFLGKANAWHAIGFAPSRRAILRAVPATFVVQCILVGVCYLVGLGLGTLFGDRTLAGSLQAIDTVWIGGTVMLALPITALIAFMERDTPSVRATPPDTPQNDDFLIIDRSVTIETFYSGPHFSRPNFSRTALVDVVAHDGTKPARAPKMASEAMLKKAEDRLGVQLPQTLRQLYLLQDGGALPPYFVPQYDGAPKTHENWSSAFADDYNDLRPLAQLKTLYDDYMEYFDPEYSDPTAKEDWLPSPEKLVILTARTGYGTALDYRKGPEPGVLLFDNNLNEPELKRFETFDAFMTDLREIQHSHMRQPREKVAFGSPPNPLDADRFWSKGSAGAGVTPEQWDAAGVALGVALPPALAPFYSAANGGMSNYLVAIDTDNDDAPLHVFPTGPYVYAGSFLKLEYFASLATLSDRLGFIDDRPPWRTLFDEPERLIVISAAFDGAILLD